MDQVGWVIEDREGGDYPVEQVKSSRGEERSLYFLLGFAARISSSMTAALLLISGWYFTEEVLAAGNFSAQAFPGCTSPPKGCRRCCKRGPAQSDKVWPG